MTKEELIELVTQIIEIGEKTEEEIDRMLEKLEKNIPHPEISDLIYYDDLTPAEIAEKALSYKPTLL